MLVSSKKLELNKALFVPKQLGPNVVIPSPSPTAKQRASRREKQVLFPPKRPKLPYSRRPGSPALQLRNKPRLPPAPVSDDASAPSAEADPGRARILLPAPDPLTRAATDAAWRSCAHTGRSPPQLPQPAAAAAARGRCRPTRRRRSSRCGWRSSSSSPSTASEVRPPCLFLSRVASFRYFLNLLAIGWSATRFVTLSCDGQFSRGFRMDSRGGRGPRRWRNW